jgi:hypothetical protein
MAERKEMKGATRMRMKRTTRGMRMVLNARLSPALVVDQEDGDVDLDLGLRVEEVGEEAVDVDGVGVSQ